jgi:hypothetical protein
LKVNKTPALGRILATKTGSHAVFFGSFSTFKQIEKGEWAGLALKKKLDRSTKPAPTLKNQTAGP